MGLVQFEDGKVLYYPYTPSAAAGYTFLVLFAILTVLHTVRTLWLRYWFLVPLIVGGICETFGYYGRAWGGSQPNSPGPFMLQLMLILVSPVLLAASVYVMRRKLREALLGEAKKRHCCCQSTTFFILTDVVAFCSQIGGGLVQVTGDLKIMDIGDKVVLGGLIFQLIVLIGYGLLLVGLYRQLDGMSWSSQRWKVDFGLLMVCVVALWVRNLVRAIEFAQGFQGYIGEHEEMLYIFDAALMLGIMGIFFALDPGRVSQQAHDDGKPTVLSSFEYDGTFAKFCPSRGTQDESGA